MKEERNCENVANVKMLPIPMLPITNLPTPGLGRMNWNWKLKLATLATLATFACSPSVLSAKALAAAEASAKEDCAAFAVRGCVRHGVSMAIRFLSVDWAVHDVV